MTHRAPSRISLRVRLPLDGVVISVAGELDRDTAQTLVEYSLSQLRSGRAVVTLDLGEVWFCDAEGLTGLQEVHGVCARSGRSLRVVGLQPQVRRVLDEAGASGVLGVAD
jgi:stage II sporulation protein AA (anti-sigma F factor antagonist)